ncbi:FadR/GntR family transcriptional regulator [Euzebya rosea]|uniref:FadR/GntR family transcriptional regulator n=1 Tax=Euzebya rosea TaxID=2052804 RepID=UPI000D3EBD25|nr:GntR family transcriptional regulator [Euzebya rosea]
MDDLEPVRRRSVPDEVADQLVDRIVSGRLAAGGHMPSERDLADTLAVSRPTVRAALQRLAQAGLVEIRQGGGTRVRDFRRHAGLDLLPRLIVGEGGLDLRVVRDVLRTRSSIGPVLARSAAEAGEGPPLDAAVRAIAEAEDGVARQRAALVFWEAVVERSGSIVYRLMFNGLRAAYEPMLDVLADAMAAEVDRIDAYTALAEAIEAGDAESAHDLAADLLSSGHGAISDLLDRIDDPTPDPPPTGADA